MNVKLKTAQDTADEIVTETEKAAAEDISKFSFPDDLDISSLDDFFVRSVKESYPNTFKTILIHYLCATIFLETDLDQALLHAHKTVSLCPRYHLARELMAHVAYEAEDYKLALSEFKTLRRLTKSPESLIFIADCYRALGHPELAIKLADHPEVATLELSAYGEFQIVLSGAYCDQKNYDTALTILRRELRHKGYSSTLRSRLTQAIENIAEISNNEELLEQIHRKTETEAKVVIDGEPSVVTDLLQTEEEDFDLDSYFDEIEKGETHKRPHDARRRQAQRVKNQTNRIHSGLEYGKFLYPQKKESTGPGRKKV